jgi:putative nucleotidyltransferase with HDIG domain
VSELTSRAEGIARDLLSSTPERLRHTVGVAERAGRLAATVEAGDRNVLVAAAWLHDIGYAPELRSSLFHPLDGAIYLAGRGWQPRVCSLVAHHSGAAFVARVCGLQERLSVFTLEESAVMDALTYADQTVGPNGRPMTSESRMSDMLARHGAVSPSGRAHEQRAPYLRAVAVRVKARLAALGIDIDP